MDLSTFEFFKIIATALITGSTGLMADLYKAKKEAKK
jgi:hypothetical protein